MKDYNIKYRLDYYVVHKIILTGHTWKYVTLSGMEVEGGKIPLRVGDSFYQKMWEHEDGSWSYSYCDAWNSFSKKDFNDRMKLKYAKCTNPISRWWFKVCNDNWK